MCDPKNTILHGYISSSSDNNRVRYCDGQKFFYDFFFNFVNSIKIGHFRNINSVICSHVHLDQIISNNWLRLGLHTGASAFFYCCFIDCCCCCHPLLPAYWGKSVSVALWGFAASFFRQSSSRAATPEGSLHKPRADSVVRICGQLKRCCVVCS